MFGKALGNGFAIAAVLGKKSIMESANNSFISSSFWGERVGFVAGLKTLEIMRKTQSWKKIKSNGEYILKNIKIIPVSEAFSILEHSLAKPVIPLNLSESDLENLQKKQISRDDVKEKITH